MELRGASRPAQISADLDRVCASEGGWSLDWAFRPKVVAPYPHPVPFWSWRPLCPGEWREGTGVSREASKVARFSYRVPQGSSREQRMRTLAEAAGSFNTLLNLGWGRYIGPRPALPRRIEDTSGVS